MPRVLDPLRFVLITVAGWMNQRQVQVIDYVVLGNWLTADLAPIRAEADPRLRWSSLLIAEPEGTLWFSEIRSMSALPQDQPVFPIQHTQPVRS